MRHSSGSESVHTLQRERRTRCRAVGLALATALLTAGSALTQPATVFFVDLGSDVPSPNPDRQYSEAPISGNPFKPVALIRRQGALTTPATVRYWTEAITATPGVDYVPISGTFTFEPGGLLDSEFLEVEFLDDDQDESNETFRLNLEVTGGATLQGRSSATITIVDDDDAGIRARFDVPRGRNENGELIWVVNTRSASDPDRLSVDCVLGGFAIPQVELSGPATEPGEVVVEVFGAVRRRSHRGLLRAGDSQACWGDDDSTACGFELRPQVPCDDLPATVEIAEVTGSGAIIGAPDRVTIEDCSVTLPDGSRGPCSGCVVDLFTAGICVLPGTCPEGTSLLSPHSSMVEAEGGVGDGVEILTTLRDGPMSMTPGGRYYRDLYDIFSPAIADALFADPFVFYGLLDAREPWLEALAAVVDGRADEAVITQDMVDSMLSLFDQIEASGDERMREVFAFERDRLDFQSLIGGTMVAFVDRIEGQGGPLPCEDSETSLCLQGGRFRVEVSWKDFGDRTGQGHAARLSPDSGTFWFFNPENIELVVKVLDGQALNDRFWVFYGALTNVEFALRVTDTVTGAVRAFENPAGTFASVGDTMAFDPEGGRRDALVSDGGESVSLIDRVAGGVRGAARRLVSNAWRTARDRIRRPARHRLQRALREAPSSPEGGGSCVPSEEALCLAGGRFRVEVDWLSFSGERGRGQARPLTADTGTFWFFQPANTELLVKVLDARELNGRFWVFYGALSNVEYRIRVTDTLTGQVRTYDNPLGQFGSDGDTQAF